MQGSVFSRIMPTMSEEHTTNESSSPAPEAPENGNLPGTPAKEDCTMAMLAHLLGIFISFIGPLLIWLIKKDSSAFVNDQGKEALNFQITIAIVYIIGSITAFIIIGCIIIPLAMVANIVFCIIAALAANKGQMYRYPFAIRLIK